MSPKIIVITPHPDDETLGVGGTLLRKKAEGATIAWLIVTKISKEFGWSQDQVKQRDDEINRITQLYDFDDVYALNLQPTQLDTIPIRVILFDFAYFIIFFNSSVLPE